ncbi:RNA polymerase sigma factor [Anaerovorax odorimutans]|uniref:RNA polymerase sigma factor n=1 Tax=Anaerovorax odorimutans TaxID=109327 RepID=UPI00040B5973|nr:sigma-70 family RNA polymerase sigma factor [Anaerovorax odorimutans]
MDKQSFTFNDCLEDVINVYANMVYRIAFSYTRDKSNADDIFQEVFFRYIRKKPIFETEEHRKAWFIRVTANCCKKMWSSAWMKKMVPLEDNIKFEMAETNNLHYELKKLPIKYRTVIHLFYYEDLSIEEISKTLKKKPSTIRTQLTRARYKLKEILKEDYDV